MDYFESEKTDEQLEFGRMDEGEHTLVVKQVEVGSYNSKADGSECGFWNIVFESVTGPSKGQGIRQFVSFDKPENLKDFLQLRRRNTLRAVGIGVAPGQRVNLPHPDSLVGRYVKATVSHWTNKNNQGRIEAQIDEIEAYQSPLAAPPQAQPTADPSPQAQQAMSPPADGTPPMVDEIPF